MIKRTDVAVEDVVKDYAKGGKLGRQDRGLRPQGRRRRPVRNEIYQEPHPAAYLEKVEQAKADIISGKIKVWNVVDQGYPDYLK